MEATTKQLMEIFGVTSKSTPSEWRKNGASVAYVKKNTWDLGEFIQWWAENIYYPKGNDEIAGARERWEKARAEKLEIEVEKMRGDLLPRDEMEAALVELITLAKRGFMILPKSAPAILYGQTETEMMATLEKIVLQVLDNMARGATVGAIEKKIKA